MSLAPHQKATVDVASIRSKVVALHEKLSGWQEHEDLAKALYHLGVAERALSNAGAALARLPQTYATHASKVSTTDILAGGTVAIRETKRKAYAQTIPAEAMDKLRVIATGQFVTVELPDGTRIALARGDLATAPESAKPSREIHRLTVHQVSLVESPTHGHPIRFKVAP